jgi:hypothetical protein
MDRGYAIYTARTLDGSVVNGVTLSAMKHRFGITTSD